MNRSDYEFRRAVLRILYCLYKKMFTRIVGVDCSKEAIEEVYNEANLAQLEELNKDE